MITADRVCATIKYNAINDSLSKSCKVRVRQLILAAVRSLDFTDGQSHFLNSLSDNWVSSM